MAQTKKAQRLAKAGRTREHERARLEGQRIQREVAAVRRVQELARKLTAAVDRSDRALQHARDRLVERDGYVCLPSEMHDSVLNRNRELEEALNTLRARYETARQGLPIGAAD